MIFRVVPFGGRNPPCDDLRAVTIECWPDASDERYGFMLHMTRLSAMRLVLDLERLLSETVQ